METYLDLKKELFNQYPYQPFLIQHRLVNHPLFEIKRLIELSKKLSKDFIRCNTGQKPINSDYGWLEEQQLKQNFTVQDAIGHIHEFPTWIVLKNVEQDPEYAAMLNQCLDEIEVYTRVITPGMFRRYGFIFISSQATQVPFHLDAEHNFLLQIRGPKIINIFDPDDPELLSEQQIEEFYAHKYENLIYKEAYQKKAQVYVLKPGLGLHFPFSAPHWVQNQNEVCISFSITYHSDFSKKKALVYRFNHHMRKRGFIPTPFGQLPCSDKAKVFVLKNYYALKGLLTGKKHDFFHKY